MAHKVASEFGHWLDAWVMPYVSLLFTAIGTVMMAYADVAEKGPAYIFWVGACVFVGGTLTSAKTIYDLERKNDALEIKNAGLFEEAKKHRTAIRNYWSGVCREIFRDLDLSDNCRISFYSFDESENAFVILGRFADVYDHRQIRRERYNAEEGVIGRAWLDGEAFEKALPNPNSRNGRYERACERKWNLPTELAEKLGMKSTCLWGYALSDEPNGVRFGIVVVESLVREELDNELLRDMFKSEHERAIARKFSAMSGHIPRLSEASTLGL